MHVKTCFLIYAQHATVDPFVPLPLPKYDSWICLGILRAPVSFLEFRHGLKHCLTQSSNLHANPCIIISYVIHDPQSWQYFASHCKMWEIACQPLTMRCVSRVVQCKLVHFLHMLLAIAILYIIGYHNQRETPNHNNRVILPMWQFNQQHLWLPGRAFFACIHPMC